MWARDAENESGGWEDWRELLGDQLEYTRGTSQRKWENNLVLEIRLLTSFQPRVQNPRPSQTLNPLAISRNRHPPPNPTKINRPRILHFLWTYSAVIDSFPGLRRSTAFGLVRQATLRLAFVWSHQTIVTAASDSRCRRNARHVSQSKAKTRRLCQVFTATLKPRVFAFYFWKEQGLLEWDHGN